MKRLAVAITLSLAILGLAWAQGDPFRIYQVEFDGLGSHPKIPSGWKLISSSPGRAPNDTNLWFQDAAGSVYMVQGFKDPNSREFLVYPYVNQIGVEK